MKGYGKLVLLIMGVTILGGALGFLRWALISRDLPPELRNQPELRVLSYSTFIGSSGPGAELMERFKQTCNCKIEVVTAGDSGLLLERLRLGQVQASFDVVIGLDQLAKPRALEILKWHPVNLSAPADQIFEPAVLSDFDARFIPFDYSPMTFIYRAGETDPPSSFEDLLKPRFAGTLSLQDPRTSSPGMQFLSWVERAQGAKTVEYLRHLKSSIHSVSPSWALSYGLFKKGQTKLVFSHLTSLAFHWGVEQDLNYKAAQFTTGHPVQVEYMAVPEGCQQCELGQQFVQSLLTPEAQSLIAAKNYMFPAVKGAALPESFKDLPQLKTLPAPPKAPDLGAWSKAFD